MKFALFNGMQALMSFCRFIRIGLFIAIATIWQLCAADSFAQTTSKSKLWKPQNKTATVVADVEQYSYATSNENNGSKKLETRFHMGIDFNFEKSLFTSGIKAHVWGLIPREASAWVDVESAFVGIKREDRQTLEIKLGRIKPDWGGLEKYSPIKQLFPQFTLDPFETHADGIVGLYTRVKEELVDVEILLSPLFIPSLGGPRFETKQGKFQTSSRWALPLYYSATIGQSPVPLKYTLHYPEVREFKDILLRFGGAARVTVKDFFETFHLSGVIMHGVDPEPRLRVAGRLNIIQETDFQGDVNILPEFYRHTAYGLEFRFKQPWFDVFVETLYRQPENIAGMEENMILANEWKNMFALQTKHESLKWPEVLVGLNNTIQFDPYIDPYFKLPKPSLNNFVSKLEWHLNSRVKFHTSTEISTEFDQGIWRNGLQLSFTKRFKMTGGMDLIMGKDSTYWGQFRSQDRLWMRGSYAF